MDLVGICVIILKFSSKEDSFKFSIINKAFLSAFRSINPAPGRKKFTKILTSNNYLDSFKHILRIYNIVLMKKLFNIFKSTRHIRNNKRTLDKFILFIRLNSKHEIHMFIYLK